MGLLWLQNRERTKSMPYPKSKERITLDDIDAPEYWVEYHLIAGMKFKDVKRLFEDKVDEDKSDQEYIEDMMNHMVIDWNLPEEEGGPILPLPSQDIQSVGKLPNVVVTYLIGRMSGQTNVPDTENLDEIS